MGHDDDDDDQGCGVVRSRRFLAGVGFLATLTIGVGFFVRLRMSNWIIFLHHTPNLGIPVEMVQFLVKLRLKQRILAVHLDSHSVSDAVKFSRKIL